MSEIVFRSDSVRKSAVIVYFAMLLSGIAVLVIAGVIIFQHERIPENVRELMLVAIPAGIICSLSGLWLLYALRGHLFVTRKDNNYGITIVNKRKKKVVEIYSPFSIRCFYKLIATERFNPKSVVSSHYLLVLDPRGKVVVTIEGERTFEQGVPEGWEPVAFDSLDPMSVKYTCSDIGRMAEVLSGFREETTAHSSRHQQE